MVMELQTCVICAYSSVTPPPGNDDSWVSAAMMCNATLHFSFVLQISTSFSLEPDSILVSPHLLAHHLAFLYHLDIQFIDIKVYTSLVKSAINSQKKKTHPPQSIISSHNRKYSPIFSTKSWTHCPTGHLTIINKR